MNQLKIVLIFIIIFSVIQVSYAQTDGSDRMLQVSDEEKIMLFVGATIAVIGIFLFLARDIVLRRKTSYDKKEHESKKDRTYEKYHSDWGDDYEEVGKKGQQ